MSKKKKKSFWADGLSINETRFSVLVLMAVVGFGYALYAHYDTGDITANLLDLVQVLIYSIVGVNVANAVTNAFRSKREVSNDSTYNEDVNQYDDDQNK